MGIADFAKQAEELADKAKGTAGGKFDSAIETAEGLTDKAADALKNLK